MAEETVGTEQDSEFDAAFAESAKISEVENGVDAPGEVGADDAGKEQEEAFDNSFTDAAVNSAASKGDVQDADLIKQLAEMKAETERLKQSDRSQRGRVAALTKKLVEQQAAKEPPKVDKVDPGQDAGAEDGDDWEEFQREFPEMAAIVDKRLAKVVKKVDSVNDRVEQVSNTQDTIVEKEITAYKETQFEILAERHPDFDQIKASDEFANFKATATPDIQAKIKSKHADDAIAVLDAFKESTGWGGRKTPKAKSEIEQINERRSAALKNSQGISSRPVGHSAKKDTGSDDDFDSAFAAFASKKEKERSVRI